MHTGLLFCFIVFLEIVALYSIKEYTIHKNYFLPILAFFSYGIIPFIIYFILVNGNNISIVNVAWNILSILYGIFIGFILFKEHITTLQWLGIFLGTISMIFMFYENSV